LVLAAAALAVLQAALAVAAVLVVAAVIQGQP
jgi:hypothetical protein